MFSFHGSTSSAFAPIGTESCNTAFNTFMACLTDFVSEDPFRRGRRLRLTAKHLANDHPRVGLSNNLEHVVIFHASSDDLESCGSCRSTLRNPCLSFLLFGPTPAWRKRGWVLGVVKPHGGQTFYSTLISRCLGNSFPSRDVNPQPEAPASLCCLTRG